MPTCFWALLNKTWKTGDILCYTGECKSRKQRMRCSCFHFSVCRSHYQHFSFLMSCLGGYNGIVLIIVPLLLLLCLPLVYRCVTVATVARQRKLVCHHSIPRSFIHSFLCPSLSITEQWASTEGASTGLRSILIRSCTCRSSTCRNGR